jgi:hypothetical protein
MHLLTDVPSVPRKILRRVRSITDQRLINNERLMAFYAIKPRASACSSRTWQPSDDLLGRIKSAYRLAIEAGDFAAGSMWSGLIERKAEIHEALLSDGPELGRLLSDPAQTFLYYGVDNIFPVKTRSKREGPDSIVMTLNGLVRLAEAVGARRVWSFENPPESARLEPLPSDIDVDRVLSSIEAAIEIPIVFPNPFPGEVGIASSRGIVSSRALHAIYQVWRLRQLLELTGQRQDGDIVEIGAGVGRVAYYSQRFGLGRYTSVDLPLTLVGQAIFLAATLGEENISLYGEANGRIRLLPPHAFHSQSTEYAIGLNADSFSEMKEDVVRGYIEALAERCSILVSINHETWPVRPFIYLRDQPGHLLRFPYWLRKSYAEEIAFFVPLKLRGAPDR